jgi:hypothetical protein
MNNTKTFLICHAIVRCIAFICITIAAIYFQKISVLWWYLVPACMGVSIGEDE